jgi:hypothetical protein
MTTLREAAQQALEALEVFATCFSDGNEAITALRAALAQQEQEPVAWIQSNHLQQAQREPFLCRVEPTQRLTDFVPLYTQPPRREWRGLTMQEINALPEVGGKMWNMGSAVSVLRAILAVQAALKEKNSG